MCLYYLQEKSDELTEDITNHFEENASKFIETLIANKNTKGLQVALKLSKPSLLTFNHYLHVAKDVNDVEINAILMEQSRSFTAEDNQNSSLEQLEKLLD